MIKLESLKADLEREETGDWIEYPEWPGVAFRVSALTSTAFVTARDMKLQDLRRNGHGKAIPSEVLTPELNALYADHILHEWRGLDVPYSAEKANEVLCDPSYRAVTEAVIWCAVQIGQIEVEFVEEAEKN